LSTWADPFDARELNSRSNYRDIGDAKSNRNPQRAETSDWRELDSEKVEVTRDSGDLENWSTATRKIYLD
jgi:hypothetical protein